MSSRVPVVLTIAGSDSGGGAGIQADLRAFWDHGWHGASVITAVTAQDTTRVWRIDPVPDDGVRAQLEAVLTDLDVAAIKIGMLGDTSCILTVAEVLRERAGPVPIVLDPVMVATSGDRLLAEDAAAALTQELAPLATLLTPNLHEAPLLCGGGESGDPVDICRVTGTACLVTGGDATGDTVLDRLATPDGTTRTWSLPRLPAGSHGTGCTLSSAIAANLASGLSLTESCERAIHYVRRRLVSARAIGAGSTVLGPESV